MINLTKLFLAFALFCSLASCGNDDDMNISEDIQGTWSVISFVAETQTSTTVNDQTFTGTSNIEGSNLDYDVTFAVDNFTTNGSYDISSTTTTSGTTQTFNQSYTNVTGVGTYSTSGNVMTIDGTFFEIEVDGFDESLINGEQMTNFEINSNGNLVFSQDETNTTTTNEITTTTTIISTSVWERQ